MTRKALSENRYHHLKAAVERTMTAREEGGRGIMDMKKQRDRHQQVLKIRNYLHSKTEGNLLLHEIVKPDENFTPLNLSQKEDQLIRITAGRREERRKGWNNGKEH